MICDFIEANREEIIRRATERLWGRPWPAVTPEEVASLPAMVDGLVKALRERRAPLASRELRIERLVASYANLARVVTELAAEKFVRLTPRETQRMVEFIEGIYGATDAIRFGHIAHELRNHLSTATLAFAALRSGRGATDSTIGAVLGRALSNIEAVVGRALAQVRMDTGNIDCTVRIALGPFLENLAETARIAVATRTTLAFELLLDMSDPTPVEVLADPHLLTTAVQNLLQNAFKYSHEGTVRLSLTVRGESAEIAVEDACGGFQGCPEAADAKERRARDRTGLGMGLDISRRAVRACGGDIHLANRPGRGCTFYITLPRAEPDRAPPRAAAPPASAASVSPSP